MIEKERERMRLRTYRKDIKGRRKARDKTKSEGKKKP